MREGLTRPLWLVLVITAFCLPLFAGLGRTDLENDEAIYSFAVDEIVARGDWLNPRSSPSADVIFLEKPPLKFWIVAAPIRLGLLPHDEFGLRFWDAVFGGAAFLYVLALGWRLAGPVCGFAAVLVLFVYHPLLFQHGVRTNNMEAPLLLGYCGAIYHYLRWAAGPPGRSWPHATAAGMYFFLGFMTKFVAALFLPMILAAGTIAVASARGRFLAEWRLWAAVAGGVAALILPWFLYQLIVSGWLLWDTMFGAHVYQRFTDSVDPSHVQRWNFYFVQIFDELHRTGTVWLALAGAAVLLARTVRKKWIDGLVVVTWFALPLALMSLGTSKLHHYAYPFLPPVALAAGYGAAWIVNAIHVWTRTVLEGLYRRTGRPGGRLSGALAALTCAAIAVSLATALLGPLRWRVDGIVLLRNADVFRPLAVALLLAVVAGRTLLASGVISLAFLIAVLPVDAYRRTLAELPEGVHPLRTVRDCVVEVHARELEAGRPAPRLYAVRANQWLLHSYYYYLRHPDGWDWAETVDDKALAAALDRAGEPRPVLMMDSDYRAFKARQQTPDPALSMVTLSYALLLLPGPYAVCGPQV